MDQDPTVIRTGVDHLSGGTTRFGEETEPMSPDRDAPALNRGTMIDRYVVIDKLGAGGMGVVYAAYDPELDRRVAIKLLLPSMLGEGRPRLMREAQAIARIAHPNVVAVHDVGELDGSVFVAMEFIDGITLTRWRKNRERSLAEILDVFRQAGRGLAAAHAADLVHRDFKPDNVLVGNDGRVRVLDFGLARGRGTVESLGFDERISYSNLDEALTEVGTVMGTPAYMSPEQLGGQVATAASDQFAFCVALYEALYGLRPFEGKTMNSLTRSVYAGKIREPPPGHTVPSWLRKVVLQGLQTKPSQRHPSMEDLLTLLEYDPSRQRRWTMLAAVGGTSLVAVAALAYATGVSRPRELCQGAADEMKAVWNDQRRELLESQLLATTLPYAADTWTRVQGHVDRYAEGWSAQSVSACEATHVQQTQSPELLERRRRCLTERLQQLDAFLDVLGEPTVAVVNHAVQSVTGLPDLDGCADVAALQAGVAPPEQEEVRQQVASIRDSMTHIAALSAAGRFADQIEQLEPLLKEAQATGYLPIIAGVEHTLARAQRAVDDPDGLRNLRAAFRDALSSGDDRRAAMVAVDMAHELGFEQRLHERGQEWLDIANAIVYRMGGADDIEVAATNAQALIAVRQARYDEALPLFERLVEEQRKIDPRSHNVSVSLFNLGSAHAENGKLEKAKNYIEEAIGISEDLLGAKHPEVVRNRANLALISMMQGRFSEAEQLLTRTIALQKELLGTEHAEYVRSLASMAVIQRNLGHPEESERLHREALEIRRRKLGPEHPAVSESLRNLAITVADLGRLEEALELSLESQSLVRLRLDAKHPDVGSTTSIVARMLVDLGRYPEALEQAEQAIAILDGRDVHTGNLVDAWCVKAQVLREQGQLEQSRLAIESALPLIDGTGSASGKVWLEQAMIVDALGERDSGLELATKALEQLHEHGQRRDRERLNAWMASRTKSPR